MPDTRKNPVRPIIGVGAVVFKNDLILLVKRARAPKKDEWSLPGGAQKLGETVREAITREVAEETGLRIQVDDLIDVIDFIERKSAKTEYHYTLIDFSATFSGGELQAGSDALDARFFSLDEALSLPLWTETRRIILKAAKAQGIS